VADGDAGVDDDLVPGAHRTDEVDRHVVKRQLIVGAHGGGAVDSDHPHRGALVAAGDAVPLAGATLVGGRLALALEGLALALEGLALALEGIALATAGLCDHSITLAFSSSSSCS
jgi:hypothetical protein